MIGKISRGKDFLGLARYLFGPGQEEEHINPRVIANGNTLVMEAGSYKSFVDDMRFLASTNNRVKNEVWHCSLRAAPDDRLMSDETWREIAAQHIGQMGLTDNPWVAVRHGDDHIHLMVCRVKTDGTVWKGKDDYKNSMDSCRAIEKKHGLVEVTEDYERKDAKRAKTTKAERQSAARRGLPEAERTMLREDLCRARAYAHGHGVKEWMKALTYIGVMYRERRGKDGRLYGFSVSYPGWVDAKGKQIWLKTSQVDKELSWPKLRSRLEPKSAVQRLREAAFPHDLTELTVRQYRGLERSVLPPSLRSVALDQPSNRPKR